MEGKGNSYAVKQGEKEYILNIKLESSLILFTLKNKAGQTLTKRISIDELKAVDQYFSSVQSAAEGIKAINTVLRTKKVAIEEENGILKIVFYFTETGLIQRGVISFDSNFGLEFGTTTTATENVLLSANNGFVDTQTTSYQNIQTETQEENFGNLDNIIPAPKLRQSHAETIDIDKVLGVVNKTVTKTTVRKSIVPENEPIKIESTNVSQLPAPKETTNDSLPFITPAEPIPKTKPIINTTNVQTSTLPIKVLPVKYLPVKTIGEQTDLSQTISNENMNIQTTTTNLNEATININETTTNYNEATTNFNEATTNFDFNQYINQEQTETTEKFSISLPKIENVDPSLLRPSIKIMKAQETKTILPPIMPQEENLNKENMSPIQTTTETKTTNIKTEIEHKEGFDDSRIKKLEGETNELKNQHLLIEDKLNSMIGQMNECKEKLHEKELNDLREENKNIKQQLLGLNSIKSQLDELNQLKLQIKQMSDMQDKLGELSALKIQAAEAEKLKKELEAMKNEKMQYEEEIKNLRNTQSQTKQETTKIETKTIQVKGEIIRDMKELELITRKISKNSKKITLNLLYKATVDSDKAASFHERCDDAQSSLVLVETDKGLRFGGFTTCSWEGDGEEKKDTDAFVFSLDKMECYDNIPGELAIGCYPKFGPVFLGCQIKIFDDAFSKGGTTFERGLNYNTEEDYELNGGEREFGIKEIEVYEVIIQ